MGEFTFVEDLESDALIAVMRSSLFYAGTKKSSTIKRIVAKHASVPDTKREVVTKKFDPVLTSNPCAMLVSGEEELHEHASVVHHVSNAHFSLAEKRYEGFPHYQCIISSENVIDNLMLLGYPNAVLVYNHPQDHAYVVLPWVSPDATGVVLSDPTAAQMWHENGVRVATELRFGTTWRYEVSMRRENCAFANLYPTEFMHLGSYRYAHETNAKPQREVWPGNVFFEKAFETPVAPPNLRVRQKSLKIA